MITNRVLIFTETIDGHVLEYINHLYSTIDSGVDYFIFVLPEDFKEKQDYLNWPSKDNIEFVFLEDSEKQNCSHNQLLRRCYEINKTVRKYAKLLKVTDVIFINLMLTMPLLPLFIPKNIKVKGIIYKIYLYEASRGLLYRWRNVMSFYLFAHFKCFKKIFLLNDTDSVTFFNDKYSVSKFCFLPDPIPYIESENIHDLRNSLNIPSNNKVFLQFGSLDERKNTLTILRAIELMSESDLKSKTFIFSGRLCPNIKTAFYDIVNRLSARVHIIVIEGFISYETLYGLCKTSDYILTLYTNVAQSSGSIGYAAFFNKIVIGPSSGLLGNLIKNYNLGLTISDITPNNIKDAILNVSSTTCSGITYVATHRVADFCKTIMNN